MKPPLFWRVVNTLRARFEARGDREGNYMQRIQVLKSSPARPAPINLLLVRSARRRQEARSAKTRTFRAGCTVRERDGAL
jgi:hypothetical protein